MKTVKIFFIGLLGILFIARAKADRRLILVAGQSNCVGKGDASLSSVGMPGTAWEYLFAGDSLVPLLDPVGKEELNFQQAASGSAWPAFVETFNRLTGDTVIIVAAARGGSSNHVKAELHGMGTWSPTGQLLLFDAAVTKVKAAMKKTGLSLSAIVWIQGERDANAINSGQLSPMEYRDSLKELIQRFRSELGGHTPFFIVKTGYYRHHPQKGFDQVRIAQTHIAQHLDQVYIAFEHTNTFFERGWMTDDIHYNQRGLNAVGEAVATQVVEKIGIPFKRRSLQTFRLNGIAESELRKGMPHFATCLHTCDTVRIAYIGGSITQLAERYRRQTTDYIRQRYPKTTVVEVAAGIPGTDADLGACRVAEQVLVHHPDLVFIEFAVNGGFPQGVEGIIRQVRKTDNRTDICLLYAATADQLQDYLHGKVPGHILQLEKLADHYGIPSVHMALYPAWVLMHNKLTGKGSQADIRAGNILFTEDGVHPLEQGGNLYAAAIGRLFEKAVMQANGSVGQDIGAGSAEKDVPEALFPDNWEGARWSDAIAAIQFSQDWQSVSMKDSLQQFALWFPAVMAAEKPGAWGTVRFEGDAIGFFDIGGPEVGRLKLKLDGKEISITLNGGARYRIDENGQSGLNRFNQYCNNRYRGQFFILQVPPGAHELTFSIDAELPDKAAILGRDQQEDIALYPRKYARSKIYIAKVLVKGRIQR